MTTITDDKWDQKVWGAATAEGTNKRDTANSNLTIYWGSKVFPVHVQPARINSDITTGQLGSQPHQRRFDSGSGLLIE